LGRQLAFAANQRNPRFIGQSSKTEIHTESSKILKKYHFDIAEKAFDSFTVRQFRGSLFL